MYDMIIIGAGACGLMAARTLCQYGKRIAVLEARDRVGGRIHSLKSAIPNQIIEAGAEFVHGDLPLTKSLLEEAGVELTQMTGKSWSVEGGILQQGEMFDKHWDQMVQALVHLDHDITMASFLQQHFADKKYESLTDTVRRFVEGYDAADLNRVSAWALRDEWTSDSDFIQYRPRGGYGQMIQYLQQQCEQNGVVFHLSTPVHSVAWEKNKVTLSAASGEQFMAAKVIMTVPIGVLQAGDIHFSPAIPQHHDAIQNFGFGGVIKFLATFKEAFWEQRGASHTMPELGFLFSDAKIPTWWTQQPDNVPFLTGWLAGPAVKGMPTAPSQLEQEALAALAYVFNRPETTIQHDLKDLRIIHWLNDPFARGAYAYATVDAKAAKKILSDPIQHTLYFAGEALYEGPEMGTVEAALQSGKRVAEAARTGINSQ